VVCKSLNVGVQTSIFIATLASLSIFFHHTVEAPLTAAGVKLSEKLSCLYVLVQFSRHAVKQAARNDS
jgi:hypothetical protein